MTAPAVLEARGLSRSFGGVQALRSVDLALPGGQRRVILGPNGAGKSVLFAILGGQLEPTSGTVHLAGRDVTALPPRRRARAGLARTFQLSSVFPQLSVRQNVAIAVHGSIGRRWRMWRPVTADRQVMRAVGDLLERWSMLELADHVVAELSYGERRKLEIVLALVGEPTVVLLDEPTAGLTNEETTKVVGVLEQLPRDIAVLLIEHDMTVANRVAEWITVLALGEVIADGPAEEIRNDPRVRALYLGEHSGDDGTVSAEDAYPPTGAGAG